ncbi:MAG: AcvB/VirJ family lysyl-phosphatidylglycerol hydrolase [Chitinophagaceae bacterium]
MKKILTQVIFALVVSPLFAQTTNLPVKEWSSSAQNPLVLYISGDGGFNNFSTALCTAINKKGYSITAISAKSYFWDKKTPEQTAKDISVYLDKQFRNRKNKQLVLAGYSFGADVAPFIINSLPDSTRKKLVSVVLLSPSESTDFEIHWFDIFGGNKKRSMDVIAEMNKLGTIKTTTIFGSDENDFPLKSIKLKNYNTETLPGGHHFDDNTDEVAGTMVKYFN